MNNQTQFLSLKYFLTNLKYSQNIPFFIDLKRNIVKFYVTSFSLSLCVLIFVSTITYFFNSKIFYVPLITGMVSYIFMAGYFLITFHKIFLKRLNNYLSTEQKYEEFNIYHEDKIIKETLTISPTNNKKQIRKRL